MKFIKTYSNKKLDDLVDIVKVLDVKTMSEGNFKTLCRIIVETDYPILRDYSAIKLKELRDERCLPYLIKSIKLNLNSNHIGFMLSACEVFDCSRYISLFVDILLLKLDTTFLDATYVIQNMKTIKKTDLIYSLNKLRLFYESKCKLKSYKLGLIIKGMIEDLEKYELRHFPVRRSQYSENI